MVDLDKKPTQSSSLIFRVLRWFFGGFAVLVVGLVSCTGNMKLLGKLESGPKVAMQTIDTTSAGYQAACQGAPLRNTEARNKAMEDGYGINGLYQCIDKASFDAVARAQVQWDAAHTPEALATAEKEQDKRRNAYAVERERTQIQAKLESDSNTLPIPLVVRKIDVNLATQDELASTPGVGPAIASQIVKARQSGRFNSWGDLVRRVVGLGAGRTALFASIGGLTVDDQSLSGAPPNGQMAALIRAEEIAREQRKVQQ